MRGNAVVRALVQLAGHVIRRRNHVVYELDLTIPREPIVWAPGERVIEIGPENIDAEMTPELLEFLGGRQRPQVPRGRPAGQPDHRGP